MSQNKIDIILRNLKEERTARKAAEKIVKNKSNDASIIEELKKSNKALESLLEKKTSQLEGVFENINNGYVLMDIFGNIMKMNDVATSFFGYDIGKESLSVYNLIYPDDLDYGIKSFITLKKEGVFTNYRTRILTKNKQVRWVQINGNLIVDKQNKPIGAQGIIRDITSEKRAEDLLTQSENRLSSLIENLDSAVLLEDEHRKIILTNNKFCELFNIPTSADLLKGVDYSNAAYESRNLFKHPKEFVSRVTSILEKREQVLGDEIIMADGETLERDYIPILKGNQYKGHLWTYKDITLRKKYRESLEAQKENATLIQEKKEELETIVNNTSIGIALTQHGRIIKNNTALQNMVGFSENEINSFSIRDLTFAEDYQSFKKYIKQVTVDKIDNFTFVKRYKRKDGSAIWTKTNVNVVRDQDKNIKHQVTFIEDITSNREKTLIIDLINNLTKSILGKTDIVDIAKEIVNNIAAYLDTDNCTIYLVNHEKNTTEKIAVYGVKMKNKTPVINDLFLPKGKGIVASVAKSGISELIHDTSKDDRYVIDLKKCLSEITVPIMSNGIAIGIIDSEHKDKNHYTHEHLKTLESVASLAAIKLRTAISIREHKKAELRNELLLKKLETSNYELNEYAHVVSHDLKSPLRSIDALVSWIKTDNEGLLNGNTLDNFNLIEDTLEKMELLISDILFYSSIDATTSKNKKVNLNIVLEDIKKILFIPNNISIQIINKLPLIIGEKTKFQQLFQNLISNAIKFNDKEKGLIQIDVLENKSFYQFSVKDNGIGIESKYLDKVFKFFHSLKPSKESSGIGLSIVKKIVDLYQGEIWIESEPDIGTTFYFTLKK